MLPFAEILGEGGVEGGGGIQEDVVDMVFAAFAFVAFREGVHGVRIGLADMPRLGGHPLIRLDVPERGIVAEGERALQGIQDVHDDHFVLLVPEMLERGKDPVGIIHQVAQNDHESAAPDPFRDEVQRSPGFGLRGRTHILKRNMDLLQIGP